MLPPKIPTNHSCHSCAAPLHHPVFHSLFPVRSPVPICRLPRCYMLVCLWQALWWYPPTNIPGFHTFIYYGASTGFNTVRIHVIAIENEGKKIVRGFNHTDHQAHDPTDVVMETFVLLKIEAGTLTETNKSIRQESRGKLSAENEYSSARLEWKTNKMRCRMKPKKKFFVGGWGLKNKNPAKLHRGGMYVWEKQ